MKLARLAVVAWIGLAAVLSTGAAQAADVKVLCSNGMIAVMHELGPQFERATGNKLVIHFDVANVLKKQIENGEPFDVAILTGPATDALIKEGKLAAATRVDIARSGVGVAMRAGAPKSDISTPEAFKRTMLAAKSVAYTKQGASGLYFASVLQQLGIADEMKPKLRLVESGAEKLVATGEAELAVAQISEILPVAGAELLGPFPPQLQRYTLFPAALPSGGTASPGAAGLIKFLTTPAAVDVIKAKGMLPG